MSIDDAADGEAMLEACLEDAAGDPMKYTPWEVTFLESLEDYTEDHVLTDKQLVKLRQIYQQRILGLPTLPGDPFAHIP